MIEKIVTRAISSLTSNGVELNKVVFVLIVIVRGLFFNVTVLFIPFIK